MINLIENELFKIFRLKKLYISVAIAILIELLEAVVYIYMKQNPSGLAADDLSSLASLNGQSFPLLMLIGFNQYSVVFMSIILADIISDEFRTGTIKLSLLRPVSRIELLNSKIVALFVSLAILLGFTLITSYLVGSIFFGWGDETLIAGISYDTIKGLLLTFQSYFFTLFSYFAFGMIIVFVSILCKNMGLTVGISLGLMTFLIVLENVKSVHNFSIWHQQDLYMNFIRDFSWGNTLIGLANIIVYSVGFYILSLIIFRKKDILS